MASSSALKASIAASNLHSHRYDVFLSFRGTDTRKTFTDHLYDSLVSHGIHTFRDDEELEKGGDIAVDLSRAIEESKIFVIIFSKNYATSKWCLNELLKITERMRMKGSEVIPIFYHVESRDVGNQEGCFKDAFLDHEKNADEEKEKTIEDWKCALKKVAKRRGRHVDDQHESKVIQDIREDIIKKLDRKPLHVGDNIVGMDVHLKSLKSLLDEVHMVGIYGIGGIGKTTIAMAVYNDISSQFDGCCFLRNIGRKDEDGQLELQETLLQDILKCRRPEFSNTREGINVIKERLRSRNVLIVLDDVVDMEQLKNLAGERNGWYGPKSRIIITSKDIQLLNQYDVKLYKVEELNHEEAIELFNWWAFKRNIPQLEEGLECLSQRVVEYAKGLPIALEVLGGFLLGNKNTDEWTSALDKLEKTPDQKVQSVLRVSYDRLEDETKSTFLDIACFFKGEDKDFVSRILGSSAMHHINVLCQRCLITISENKLYMHDLLQQMGHEIIRQKYSSASEGSSRFWDPNDVVNMLRRNKGTKKMEGLFIDINSTSGKIQFTTKVFKRMNKLRLLKVYNCFGNEVHLPIDFEFPSSELTYLYWDGYPLESLPTNFDGTELVELNLMYGSIKQLWERNKILDNVKVINLSYSKNLIEIPDFSTMRYLEILILEDGCTSLESLPRNFHKLELLRSLSCDGCSKLKSFPEIGSKMTNLRELNLSKTAITEVPSLIRHLHGLEGFNLSYCKNLAILPDGICGLSSLRNLRLDWCLKLKDLPEMKADMKNLERLDLSSTAIEELPSSIGHLKALKHLHLSCCENLVSLPGSFFNLSSLEALYLQQCSRLEHFPEIRSDMKNLKILDLQSTAIKELPSSLGRLPALEHLYLSGCKYLKHLPETICNLSSLITLHLHGCSRLRSFPEIKGNMKSLTTLDLGSTGIKELPSSVGRLHALEQLYLSGCMDLVNLPESICNLSSLKTLHIRDCSKLHGSKLDLGGLQCLEDLQLSYISCEWGCLSGLCTLRSLHLSCCHLEKGLMERSNFFSTLKSFVASDCNLIEGGGFPSDIQHLIKFSIEKNHPPMARGSSSHSSKFGHHGSEQEKTNVCSCNKRNPPEQSPPEEQPHKRFRGPQD